MFKFLENNIQLDKKDLKELENILNNIIFETGFYITARSSTHTYYKYHFVMKSADNKYEVIRRWFKYGYNPTKEALEVLERFIPKIRDKKLILEIEKRLSKWKDLEGQDIKDSKDISDYKNQIKVKEKTNTLPIKKDNKETNLLVWILIIGFWIFVFSGVIWPDKTDYSNGRTLDCRKPENSYQCELLEQRIYESEIQKSQFDRLPY